jgi:hypothetical protein
MCRGASSLNSDSLVFSDRPIYFYFSNGIFLAKPSPPDIFGSLKKIFLERFEFEFI